MFLQPLSRIVTEAATVEISRLCKTFPCSPGASGTLSLRPVDPQARSFATQLEALVVCVRGTEAPSPNVADGLAVAEAVAAAREGLSG